MITHYDLFAGIGGFSIALEEVFDEPIKHIFCEWESFPTAVLRQHWPDGEFWGDIAELVTHTNKQRPLEGRAEVYPAEAGQQTQSGSTDSNITIVTGGFPCQPFSHAGRRRGTADDRYQWPNMFAVIRNVKPEWVIAENVRGLVTWNDGLVLETVCADLESEGYEVQPFIIPAVAKGAPHRRDRVWIIGHAKHDGQYGTENSQGGLERKHSDASRQNELRQPERADSLRKVTTDPSSKRRGTWPVEGLEAVTAIRSESQPKNERTEFPDWQRNWQEVAFATCDDSVDDGLPRLVDGVPYSRAKWRRDSLKAYGNGIVSQVAMEVLQAIKSAVRHPNTKENI